MLHSALEDAKNQADEMNIRSCNTVDVLAGHEMDGTQSGTCEMSGHCPLEKGLHIPTGRCASDVMGNSFTYCFGGTLAFLKWPNICRVTVFAGLFTAAT